MLDKLVQAYRASLVKSDIPMSDRVQLEREFTALSREGKSPDTAYRSSLVKSGLSNEEKTELLEEFSALVSAKELGI